MPRYNGAATARAAALGQELRASASFDDDSKWHTYQNQVQNVLRPDKQLPSVGDPKRRTDWQGITKMHKKMIAQLNADGRMAASASSSTTSSSAASLVDDSSTAFAQAQRQQAVYAALSITPPPPPLEPRWWVVPPLQR